MDAIKFLFVSFVLVGILCTTNGGSSQQPSSPSDLKKEASDQKTLASSSSPATPTTTVVSPAKSESDVPKGSSSGCGGVRGFLHLCVTSSEVEEPSKNVEKRGILKNDSRESSEEKEDSSDSSENSDERSKERFGQTYFVGSVDVRVKPLARITKRQVDPRAICESESSEETYKKY